MRSASAMCAAIAIGLAVVRAQRALAIGGIDLDDHRWPPADVVDPRGDAPRVPARIATRIGQGRSHDGCREGEVQAGLIGRLRADDASHDVADTLRLGRQQPPAAVGETDAVVRARPRIGSRFHVPVRYVGTAVAGSTAGTEALERERRGEAHAVELGLRLKPHTRARRLHLELVAERRAGRAQQEGVVAELGEGHPVALGERVVGGRDEHEVFLEERLGARARRRRREGSPRRGRGGP